MEIINTLIILIALATLSLGVITLIKNPKDELTRSFFAITIAIVVWSLSMLFFRIAQTNEAAKLGAQFLYVSASVIPVLFVYFVLTLVKKQSLKVKILLTSVFVPLLVLFIWPNNLIRSASVEIVGNNKIYFGPLSYIYIFYFTIFFAWGLWALFKHYKRSEKIEKIQTRYVLIGSIIPIVVSSFSNLLPPHFGYFELNWLGNISIIFMPIFFTYAIIRHHLLNIRVITTELFMGLIIITTFINVLLSTSTQETILSTLLFVVVTVFGIFLIRQTLWEIKTLENLSKAKSEFISIASHQLRTPLSIIKGYISMMREGTYGDISAKQLDVINKIYITNEGMLRLVNDLLNVSRAEKGELHYLFEKIDIRDIINTAVTEFSLNARNKNLAFHSNMPEVPFFVLADKDKLKQAIMNLLDNAIKYTETGGVAILLSGGGTTKKYARVYIKDTGIGLNQTETESIFQKFERSDRGERVNAGGAGLGLYIAKRIVQDHKGRIWVESEGKNRGSTFIIELPLIEPPQLISKINQGPIKNEK